LPVFSYIDLAGKGVSLRGKTTKGKHMIKAKKKNIVLYNANFLLLHRRSNINNLRYVT